MQKERLEYVDILKGLGILLVVFSHSGAEEWFMTHFGDFFVPLFFIASGYTYSHYNIPFSLFIKKRSKRLLLPYLIFSFLLLLLYKRFAVIDILGVFYSRYCLFPYNSADNIFLMGGGNPPLWFLTSMLTALFPFVLLMKYPRHSLMIVLCCFIFTYSCQFLPILLPWSIDTAGLTGLFMYSGVMLRKVSKLFDGGIKISLLLILLFVIFCIINGGDNLSVREYGQSFFLYFVISLIGTVFLLRFSKRLERTMMRDLLADLGRHSLVIFCLQMFLLRICHQVFHNYLFVPTDGWIFYIVSAFKVLIVAIVGSYISKLMMKYMTWLFR